MGHVSCRKRFKDYGLQARPAGDCTVCGIRGILDAAGWHFAADGGWDLRLLRNKCIYELVGYHQMQAGYVLLLRDFKLNLKGLDRY